MKFGSLFYICLFMFISLAGFTQTKKYLYYFDKDMNITSEPKSVFFGIGLRGADAVELKCFNKANKNIVFIAHYPDSSLKVMDGLFQSYYPNGYQENEGNFLQGKENGLWQRWDSLGNLMDSSIYENGKKIMWGIFAYYQNGIQRSMVVYDMKNPKLDKVIYYDEKGNIADPKTIKKSDDPDKIFTRTEIEASFPGGNNAWNQYILQQIRQHMKDLENDPRSQGTCRIKFIVDKEGNVTDVQAINMQDSKLAKIVISALTNGPKWLPAMQNGMPVKAYREQPVTYTYTEN